MYSYIGIRYIIYKCIHRNKFEFFSQIHLDLDLLFFLSLFPLSFSFKTYTTYSMGKYYVFIVPSQKREKRKNICKKSLYMYIWHKKSKYTRENVGLYSPISLDPPPLPLSPQFHPISLYLARSLLSLSPSLSRSFTISFSSLLNLSLSLSYSFSPLLSLSILYFSIPCCLTPPYPPHLLTFHEIPFSRPYGTWTNSLVGICIRKICSCVQKRYPAMKLITPNT